MSQYLLLVDGFGNTTLGEIRKIVPGTGGTVVEFSRRRQSTFGSHRYDLSGDLLSVAVEPDVLQSALTSTRNTIVSQNGDFRQITVLSSEDDTVKIWFSDD